MVLRASATCSSNTAASLAGGTNCTATILEKTAPEAWLGFAGHLHAILGRSSGVTCLIDCNLHVQLSEYMEIRQRPVEDNILTTCLVCVLDPCFRDMCVMMNIHVQL